MWEDFSKCTCPSICKRASRLSPPLKEPFDLLLTGGRVVDVATLELREADIGVVGAMIASVHPRGTFGQDQRRTT